MENNNESYEDILWNKYDHLQKRLGEKSLYYQSSIKYFKNVLFEIEKHLVNLTLINNEVKLKKPTKLDEIFTIFKESMNFFLENHKKLINKIIIHLEKYLTEIKKEKPIYNNFKHFYHNYQAEQKKFNQIKEKFHEIALAAETKTLKKVQKKNEKKTNEQVDLPKRLKNKVGNNLKKYQISLTEINKKREEYNTKQTVLIKFFVDIEKKELNTYYAILGDFLKIEFEKTIQYFYQKKINYLVVKNNTKDLDKELQLNLKKFKSNEKKDEKISFEYKSNIDFDKCLEKDDFNTYAETVSIIKNNFNSIYEGITLEKEQLKNNIRELIKRFYELDNSDKLSELKPEEIQSYFDLLKEPSTHSAFIKLITQLRTNSKFERQKILIEILGKSFKIVLDEAEKNKNYHTAKNCLILSQTFYYNERNDENKIVKKYALEYLKVDSWLTKKDFWVEYCLWMVEEELKKYTQLFSDINFEDIKNNKLFSPKKNSKISEIIFSQLLPSISNMLEITKNNMYAIEIIELFHEKFIYLNEDNIESLFLLISNDKEEIQKMRNIYLENKKGIVNFNEIKNENINNLVENNIINEDIEKDSIIINENDKEKDKINLIINDNDEGNSNLIINEQNENNIFINENNYKDNIYQNNEEKLENNIINPNYLNINGIDFESKDKINNYNFEKQNLNDINILNNNIIENEEEIKEEENDNIFMSSKEKKELEELKDEEHI